MDKKLSKSTNNGIYDYDNRIKRTLSLMQKEFSQENFEIINEYQNVMITESLAKATIHKHLQTLLNLTRILSKNWKDVTKTDIDSVVAQIVNIYSGNGQETNTTHDHKKVLKIFFRWLKLGSRSKDEVGDPSETKNIKTKRVKDKISREDLLTESDRTKLLHACAANLRDRALIDCFWDGGTRPGEILNLQIKHVKNDSKGLVLQVDGKTGARPVRLIESIPSLSSWLDSHPFRENPEAPLWINLNKTKYGQPLSYSSARQMIIRRCQIAGLSKRVYLNLFRHSEATRAAKFLTEAHMKKRHGWTSDSKMPGRYIHLVDSDVDDAIFKHHGITNDDEKGTRFPQVCSICRTFNEPSAKLCSRCSKPLSLDAIETIEENQKQEVKKMAKQLISEEIEEWKTKYFELQNQLIQRRSEQTLANAMEGIPTVIDLKEIEAEESFKKLGELAWQPILPYTKISKFKAGI